MGKITGFMEFKRETPQARPAGERIKDYEEIYPLLAEEKMRMQAARCMECGIPFCHGAGCPLGNLIPEFNDLIYRNHWREALQVLELTNNFPEFTGRLCPAMCEPACVSSLHDEPVTVRQIELQIIEKGFSEGLVKPQPPVTRTGKSVAIVGSGPSGLACADQLNRAGHRVVVFEQKDRPGGLLRYGIPDFKLDKGILDRRLHILEAEGIEFQTNVEVGRDISAKYMARQFDAICLAGGAMAPRNLTIPGRELQGIHYAMDYLEQQNRKKAGETIPAEKEISAKGKRVAVIGGGDTGADCVGTANRQGASEIYQLEILPEPPSDYNLETPWPEWPQILRSSSSHEEGCIRRWSVMTTSFPGQGGRVKKLQGVKVNFDAAGGGFTEMPGSEFELDVDLVLLAMGFVHPVHEGMVNELGLALDKRGNVAVDEFQRTSLEKIFSAGDMVRGASLVVNAIYQGRRAARGIDEFLMGETSLP
jgi:glutamate synthase (NADPH/NADH) small chain